MPLIVWGAMLLVLTAVQLPFGPSAPELALLGGAGAACLLTGVAMKKRGQTPFFHRAPAMALSPLIIALGLGGLVVGAEAGLWLVLIGAGTTVAGIALAVQEGEK
jgi:hypothetical protein